MSFSKKREMLYLKPDKPNADFAGNIVAETADGVFNIIDVQSGKVSKSLRGYHPSKNLNGEMAALSSFDGSSDVYVYDKNGELKYTINGQKIISSEAINKYYAVSLSPDGNYLALVGSALGFGFSGDPVYVIIDKQGKTIAKIDANTTFTWAPSWTVDNQCLVGGADKIALVNPQNKSVKTLYNKRVKFASLSRNQQRMLIINDNRVSILDVASGGEELLAGGQYDAVLSSQSLNSAIWSPDEKSIAVSLQTQGLTGYKVVILALDGSNSIILANDNGEDWRFSSNYIGY